MPVLQSKTAANFINPGISWPDFPLRQPALSGPAYPLPAPGVRVPRQAASNDMQFQAAVFNGDPTGRRRVKSAAPPPPDRHGVQFSGAAFVITEAELRFNQIDDAQRASGRRRTLGPWYDTSVHSPTSASTTTGLSLADPRRRHSDRACRRLAASTA